MRSNFSPKVAFFTLTRLGESSGGSRRNLYEARFLRDLGYELMLFVGGFDKHLQNEFDIVNLGEYSPRYYKSSIKELLVEFKLCLRSSAAFIKLLLNRFRIVHICSSRVLPLFLILLIAKIKRARTVFEYRDLIPETALLMRQKSFSSPYYSLLSLHERIMIYTSDAVIVISQTMKEALLKRHNVDPNKIFVIYPPIEPTSIAYSKDFIRKKYHLQLDTVIFIYIGKLEPEVRGLEVLLASFQKALKRSKRKLHLLIVGDGPIRNRLQRDAYNMRIAGDHITFIGQVLHDEALEYLYASDISVIPYPSSLETEIAAPVKLFESMENGKIILCSDLKEARRILGDCAIYFKSGDVEDLTEKICFVADNLEELRVLENKIKERVRNYYYDNQKVILQEIFEKLL